MLRNYFKTAWRNLQKQKLFSLVNILGLAIGIAVTFLIINYTSHEFSFDNFHHNKDRIYRVESNFYEGNNLTDSWPTTSFGYGSAMKKEIPGIEDFTRIALNNTEQVVRYGDQKIRETGIAYTDPAFFRIFDFKLLLGDKTNALTKANSVVITQSSATQFFGNENPIGKILSFAKGERRTDCIVTGVIEDFPANSHIHFNYLIAYEGLPAWMKEFWYIHEVYTYVLLQPGVFPKTIEDKFPAMAEKYKTAEALKTKKWAVSLVPLTSIHLNPQKTYEAEIKGNKTSLITLIVVAIVILLTAWINYINLTTARSLERAKEVGIRKVAGALRSQLIKQFLVEAGIINITAALLAFVIIFLAQPYFNQLTGTSVTSWLLISKPLFWIVLLLVLTAGIFLSGFYPALVLSAVKPASILKGKYAHSTRGNLVQQVLVVFQFSATLFLMIGMFVVQKQIRFMHQQDLGVNIDRTIVLKYPVSSSNLNTTVQQFSEHLKNLPNIKSVSVAGSVPGLEVAKFASNTVAGNNAANARLYEMLTVDYDYINMFGLQMAAGRSFKKDFGDEKNNLLVNEAALPQMGFRTATEAIGKKIMLEGEKEPVTIIGIVKNWHQRGLGNTYTPIMFILNGKISWVPAQYIAVKINSNQVTASMETLKTAWNSYFPDASFDSFFLDSFFNEQYKADKRFGSVIQFFTGIAFFISILGLWAMSAYTAIKKVKEVGIRKVFGAGNHHILLLFSKNIIALIAIAFLIAVPLSYLVMHQWLNHFAFRTGISLQLYFIAALIALLIVFVTVIWQSILVSAQNPVKSLRRE
ncbi:MAG: ABC transporter permease [Chitinophagaceae bacterium]